MKRYNPSEIEPKWQQHWAENRTYVVTRDDTRQKAYVAGMFPYPSGAGLHVGHVRNYSIVDAIARFHRQRGHNVMQPFGWDTFGLPAENYAIKTGRQPAEVTQENIASFKNQLTRLGVSIDWSRELNTSDPEYYRWTQWIFTKLFERGLAYQKTSLQWWCPFDKTVLANEQVEGGRCWRCGNVVEKKSMKQWFFKITEYADALLEEIPELNWPQKIKTAQTNWIGRSQGAEVEFKIDGYDEVITVFTTRPDTLFGATFLVLAPEHPLSHDLLSVDAHDVAENYVREALKRSEIDRSSDSRDKTGVPTGSHAINPATGERIPIWIADYVLGGYGTGAIMAVPAHDQRDFEFAEKFHLPIVEVITKPIDAESGAYKAEGTLQNSGVFDGMTTDQAREEIVAWLEQERTGHAQVTYKMRDWLISRQRYWGAPIPVIHCPEHGAVAVPEDQLPVVLPHVDSFAPTGDGKSPLAHATDWVNTTCPKCGTPALRETDTMDGYACSSWYLLRYTDPHSAEMAWDPTTANYWAPLDFYVGGDHAVQHLLYVRFWTHFFRDLGLIDFREPVKQLVYNGYINATDGTKMSKSKGNVVDPLELVDQGYGADALRVYELFIGPYDLDAAWEPGGIAGTYRFLNRVWTLTQEFLESDKSASVDSTAILKARSKTVKKVSDDLTRLSFNTAISALMEYTNDLYKLKLAGFDDNAWPSALSALLKLVAPFAPHLAHELLAALTETDAWPDWDDALLQSDTVTLIVQVNGKLRGRLEVAKDASEADVSALALEQETVVNALDGKSPHKTIHVPNRLINFVV
jgi:leucyl-tRNA synthetase